MTFTLPQLVACGLTLAESKVVELVLQGKSNKEASNALSISQKTVKFHLTKTYRKFEVKSRSELIVKFLNSQGILVKGSSSGLPQAVDHCL